MNTSVRTGYDKTFAEFMSYFPISDTGAAAVGQITPYQKETKRGYFEARAIYRNPAELKEHLGNLTADGVADDYMVVSMGDEIALPVPGGAAGQQQFEHWMSVAHPGVHVGTFVSTRTRCAAPTLYHLLLEMSVCHTVA